MPPGQGFAPTPRISAYVLKSIPMLFRFLAHSLTNVRSLGLRRAVSPLAVICDPVVVLSGMSCQIAPQTRSAALRRTKRDLNALQGMEGAKNAYRGSQEVRRAETPNQVLSGRQEPRQPPAKPICTVQAAIRLVGGRRPSMLQRWGSGVLPRRFPVALKAHRKPLYIISIHYRNASRVRKTHSNFTG